jgi:hypothetical protein
MLNDLRSLDENRGYTMKLFIIDSNYPVSIITFQQWHYQSLIENLQLWRNQPDQI